MLQDGIKNKKNNGKKERYFFIDLIINNFDKYIIFMLSLTKKLKLIFFLVLVIPLSSFSQNRQNKYYNPIRISVSAITKFVVGTNDHATDKYQFDQGIGAIGEIIYTIDQKAKYEVSVEAGFLSTFSNSNNTGNDKYLIPIALNAYYYFFDETFSPFIGLGFGVENFNNSSKYVLKPSIGISNEKLKVFARYGIGNTIGSSIEIGIGYSFKERPCGCFPQTR